MKDRPLSPDEVDRLAAFLESCGNGDAMNLEELDGFFAALIAGPELVMPSEYLAEVFGGEIGETCEFESLEHANEILALMNRHWNCIAATLYNDETYVPLLLPDEKGVARGNDWAHGFMHGTYMRHDHWVELVKDEDNAEYLIPIMMLHYENDEDRNVRPKPITPAQREKLIGGLAWGLRQAYRYFREPTTGLGEIEKPHKAERRATKVGRNEPCPCGSGKKYRKCCGGAVVQ